MKISIVTLFPDMIEGFFKESIIKKAQEKGLVEIELINLRDFAVDEYGSVDDRPYSGGAGMVLRVEPVYSAIQKVTNDESRIKKIILTSAKGQQFNQRKAQELSTQDHIVILCGHYEGFDERILQFVDEEISLGDFVMTGGEITATAITDAVVRLLPGVLKKDDATEQESFFSVNVKDLIKLCGEDEHLRKLQSQGIESVQLLEYPHYTRPAEFMDQSVPEVLLHGNHAEIEKWRIRKAYEETVRKRPDLLDK